MRSLYYKFEIATFLKYNIVIAHELITYVRILLKLIFQIKMLMTVDFIKQIAKIKVEKLIFQINDVKIYT